MKIGNLEVYGIIYKITNLVNGKVYIGQTTDEKGFNGRYNRKGKGIERVYNYHNSLKSNNYDSFNFHLFNSISKYGFNNFKVIEIFDIAFSEDELNIKEQCWIQFYNSFKNGYNKNLGGNGNLGHNAPIGEMVHNSVVVIQLNLKGEFIRKWDYMTQTQKEKGYQVSSIYSCCQGKSKSAYGFMWKYEKDYNYFVENNIPIIYKNNTNMNNKKEIVKLDMDGNLIKEYLSITEASIELYGSDKLATFISSCCNKKAKSCYGFLWFYKDEYEENVKFNKKVKYSSKIGKHKMRQIVQFDLNSNFLKCYDSMKEIININPSFNRSLISKCCNRKNGSSNKYLWAYLDDYNNGYIPKYYIKPKYNKKRIVRLSKDNKLLNIYDNISLASMMSNVSKSSIENILYKKTKKPRKYIWKYYEDYIVDLTEEQINEIQENLKSNKVI